MAPELLGLPAEILKEVIAAYVTEVGVCEAWKRRQTCTLFASCITDEVLAFQPIQAFEKDKKSKHLLIRLLPRILVYRCQSLHGFPAELPKFIRSTVTRFIEKMETPEDQKEDERDYLTRALCYAIARDAKKDAMGCFLLCPGWYPVNPDLENLTESEGSKSDAVIAVALGRRDIFAAVVPGNECYLPHCSPLFESPISLAASKGDITMVTAILDTSVQYQRYQSEPWEDDRAIYRSMVNTGMEEATKNCNDTAISLMRHYKQSVDMQDEFFFARMLFDSWIQKAVIGQDERLIKTVLALFDNRWCIPLYTARQAVVRIKGTDLMRRLLAAGPPETQRKHMLKWNPDLLIRAVRAKSHDAVCVLLEMGANPNVVKKGELHPIKQATVRKDVDMVKLLLDHGASPAPCLYRSGQVGRGFFFDGERGYELIKGLLTRALWRAPMALHGSGTSSDPVVL